MAEKKDTFPDGTVASQVGGGTSACVFVFSEGEVERAKNAAGQHFDAPIPAWEVKHRQHLAAAKVRRTKA